MSKPVENVSEKPKIEGKVEYKINWIEIRQKFDSLQDVDLIFYFLTKIVDELKLCSSVDCKIFPELHRLDLMRMNFRENKTLQDAQKNIKNKLNLKSFQREFEKYIVYSKHTFNKIYALKVTKDTEMKEHKENFYEYIKSLEVMNDNLVPVTQEYIDVEKKQFKNVANNAFKDRLLKAQQEFKEVKKEMDENEKNQREKESKQK